VQSVSHGDGCENVDEVVLTDKQLAWRCTFWVNSGIELSVFVVDRGQHVSAMLGAGWADYSYVGNLVGDRSSIAFNNGRGPALWLVSETPSDPRARRCPNEGARRCVEIGTHLVAADADTGRIAAWKGAMTLVLLDFNGRVEKELHIARTPTHTVTLEGQSIFIDRNGVLTRHSSANGKVTGRWRLGGALEDVDAGLVAYTTKDYSRLWLLRLRDGRRVEVPLPPRHGYVTAALDESGLFYTYTGRIEFRSMSAVASLFKK
jgi:hypothetical protein